MKQPRAIVLIFSGEEPTQELLAVIAANIGVTCETDRVDPFVLDPKEIAHAILAGINLKASMPLEKEAQCKTPEDRAAVLIGNILKDSLIDSNYSTDALICSLVTKIREAKANPNNEFQREFMKSLFVLSQPDLKFNRSILKDMHLDKEKLAVIRDTYNLLKRQLNE